MVPVTAPLSAVVIAPLLSRAVYLALPGCCDLCLDLEVARIGDVITVDVQAGVPPAGGPCLADQAADRDDGIGKVEERVDDLLALFVAALQPAKGVVPGVGPLGMPALAGQPRIGWMTYDPDMAPGGRSIRNGASRGSAG